MYSTGVRAHECMLFLFSFSLSPSLFRCQTQATNKQTIAVKEEIETGQINIVWAAFAAALSLSFDAEQ